MEKRRGTTSVVDAVGVEPNLEMDGMSVWWAGNGAGNGAGAGAG